MHGFVRYAFRLASVLAVVLVDLVLKAAFPIRVVAHASLLVGQGPNGRRRAVGMARRTALPREGAACERNIDCIVGSSDGYAASLPERKQEVRPGAVTRAKRLTVSASKRGHCVNPERESPAGVRKWMRFIAQGDRRA